MMDDTIQDAITEMSAQMDYELRGAWRAGYNWLHVYDKPADRTIADTDERMLFRLSMYVHPSYQKEPPQPDDLVYRYSYELNDLSRELVRQFNG